MKKTIVGFFIADRAGLERVMCFDEPMENDPQNNVDVPADAELADEMLGDVSGGGGLEGLGGNGGAGGIGGLGGNGNGGAGGRRYAR